MTDAVRILQFPLVGDSDGGIDPLSLFDDAELSQVEQAVCTSVWSDARATADDSVPDGTSDRRGWWADPWNTDGGSFGSRLWLLTRSPLTTETANAAQRFTRDALAWILASGMAKSIDVAAQIVKPRTLLLAVTVTKPDGVKVALHFSGLWGA